MKQQFPYLISLLAMGVLIACAADKPAPPLPPGEAGLTNAQQAAYDKCLKDRQMVAMSWEAIKEQCRSEATRRPDPSAPTS